MTLMLRDLNLKSRIPAKNKLIYQIDSKSANMIVNSNVSNMYGCPDKNYSPRGLFILFEEGKYIGLKNDEGSLSVKEFNSKKRCKKFLLEE